MDFPFASGDYVTLGGLVYHALGRIPTVGEVVELDGGLLKVLEMDKHRITKVLFQNTGMDESTGNVRLADELSPPGPEDSAEDSKPNAGNAETEGMQYDAGAAAPDVEPTEPEPEPGSSSVDAASVAAAARQPDESDKLLT